MPLTFDFTYNVLTGSTQDAIRNAVAKARIPEYEPKSFFFTEISVAEQASVTQAYGPSSGTKFNITSRFSLENKKAFAVAEGQVLVVPQTGSTTKVNVVLKPTRQSSDIGVPVKYFVYRGLLKNTFINGVNLVSEGAGNTPFVAKIWQDFKNFNFETPPTPLPALPAAILGYKENEADDVRIEPKFFNRYDEQQPVEEQNYNLPYILAGQHFGNFADNDGGFEIVLDTSTFYQERSDTGFELDMAYAQSPNFILDTATIAANVNVSEKMYRHNVHRFMDPAAFYGAHITKKDKGQIKIADSSLVYKSKSDIYLQVLSKFINKNKLYLYVQWERGRHYNYDNTLGTESLKVGTTTAPVAMGYVTNSWPILILESEQAHTASESEEQKNNNRLVLNLKFKTELKQAMLYNIFGDNSNAEYRERFLVKDALVVADDLSAALFTRDIKYNLTNTYGVNGSTSLTVKNTANYIFLVFQETREDYLNDIFGPVNAEPMIDAGIFSERDLITLECSRQTRLVNRGDSISNIQQQVLFHGELIPANGEDPASDNRSRLYIAKMLDRIFTDKDGEQYKWHSGGFSCISSKEDYATFVYGKDYQVWKGTFTDNGTTVGSLQLLNFKLSGNAENFMQLGISETEYNLLSYNSETVPSNPAVPHIPLNASNLTFCFKDRLVSNPTHFVRFTLGIKYENPDGTTVEKYPSADIYIYTLDEYYFFTKQFSENFDFAQEFAPSMATFRTKDSYLGEFGFDWLRLGNYSVTQNSQSYPEHSYESILLGGYAQNTFNWFNNSSDQFSNGGQAFTALKKHYINIGTQRDKEMYYVPYLNLYPLSEGIEGGATSATLIVSVKNEISIGKFELEYDEDLFIVNLNTALPLGVQGGESEIEITCLEPFDDDKSIKINAYVPDENNVMVPKLAGIIKVCRNSSAFRKELKFALVRVKTNLSQTADGVKTGEFGLAEKTNLRLVLQQFYIDPVIEEVPFELPLETDANFFSGGQFIVDNQYIDPQNPELQSYLRQKLASLPEGSQYNSHFKIFAFDVHTPPSNDSFHLGGNVDKIGVHSANLYKSRGEFTLGHEVLHGLGLGHTHEDSGHPVATYQKFLYPNFLDLVSSGNVPNVDVLKATDNLMSYNSLIRKTLWRWQWEIMRKNIENTNK